MKKIILALGLIILLFGMSFAQTTATKLVWDASSGVVDGYKVYVGTQSGNYTIVKNTTTRQYLLSDLGLTEGTTYYAVVKGYNIVGESMPSNEVVFPYPFAVPGIPGVLRLE